MLGLGVGVLIVLLLSGASDSQALGYVNPAMTAWAKATPTFRPTATTITNGAYPVWYNRGR